MKINNDTIIAQSTPIGLSGIGVIRISGPLSKFISKKILGCIPKPRYAKYTKFKNSKNEIIDIGIAIFFSKPNSYTGEDVLELHTHGNPIILNIIIQDIISLSTDIRYAKSGEFTKRAVLNNKLDLIQAEAINDIINANSELSIKYAINNLKGNLSNILNIFFYKLINIKKNVEHLISFENDELEDTIIIKSNILNPLQYLISKIDNFIFNIKKKSPVVKGFKVVISGKANVGKSSLFNAILGYERAIVTDLKGTTRDVISEFIYLNKTLPIYLFDTAGIRKNFSNKVEQKGIELTMQLLKEANVIIYIIEYNNPLYINREINNAFNVIKIKNIPIIFVINKIDKDKNFVYKKKIIVKNTYNCIFVSKKENKNLLLNTIHEVLDKKYIYNNKSNFIANDRQINYIYQINKHLKNIKKTIIKNNYCINDICCEELYLVENKFNELFGKKHDFNNLLNDIFNTFCIGK